MSNTKHLADLLKVCSILPALVIMPAVAGQVERVVTETGKEYTWTNNTISGFSTNPKEDATWEAGLVKVSKGSTLTIEGGNYSNIKSAHDVWGVGGVVGQSSNATNNATVVVKDYKGSRAQFKNNSAYAAGGAMWLGRVAEIENADFIGNSVYGTVFGDNSNSDTSIDGGGALFFGSSSIVAVENSDFVSNTSTSDGGAIAMRAPAMGDNSAAKLDIFDDRFSGNSAVMKGGAIYSTFYDSKTERNAVYIKGSQFEGNSAASGGAIYNDGVPDKKDNKASMKIVDSEFTENTAGGNGAAIFNKGNLSILDSDFDGNIAYGYYGGAIYNTAAGNIKVLDADFDGNKVKTNDFAIGGAIANIGKVGNITGEFDNNTVVASGEEASAKGGAIYTYSGSTIESVVADFVGNSATSDGEAIGGAVVNDGTIAKLGMDEDGFVNNKAVGDVDGWAGALYNSETGVMSEIKSDFTGNSVVAGSKAYGGAIVNKGKLDSVSGVFANNTAIATGSGAKVNSYGGAIYNEGEMTVNGGNFVNNSVNTNSEAWGFGGAISNYYGNMSILGAEDSNVVFENNAAYVGGAFADKQVSSQFPGMKSETFIKYALFEDNHAAADAGAAGLYGDADLQNVIFRGNTAGIDFNGVKADAGNSDGGGAVQIGGTANVTMADVYFAENESAVRGGAISARHGKQYTLDIDTATFTSNKSGNFGGGIANIYAGTVDMNTVDFVSNSAKKAGGAIYNGVDKNYGAPGGVMSTNHGVLVFDGVNNFIGNTAGEFGGAIFNDEGGTINMAGVNTFAGNKANGAANDIYNLGYLNIVSGTVSMDGGVKGTGSLVLAEGATLDIANTTIKQTTIELNGTVKAALVNNQRGNGYGRFVGDVTIGENALFELNVGATGTYDIWSGALLDKDQVKVGIAYEVADIDENGVTIVTKAADSLAEDAGITTQAAGTVAGLANSSNGKAHQVSLALQDALNSGNTEFVEAEVKKLNPDDKPVVQAAATSIQNQVLALTAGRMAGGVSIGRAGGDASQENAFWIQGLFNKSKFADKFHGYTRGVAMGADTLIDKTWTIGGGLAFNNSDVHSNARHTSIDSKTLFGYMQYKPTKWFVNATATYNMSEYTENITAAGGVSVSNTFDVDSYGAQIMTGYDFATGITTELGARYLHVAQDGYTDELGLVRVDALDTDFLSGVAGLKYAFAIENDWSVRLRPELRAAMTYDIISDDSMATVVMPGVASYKVHGDRLSRMGGEFGIGLTALYNGIELSVMYDLDLHRDYTSQTGMIKFRAKF